MCCWVLYHLILCCTYVNLVCLHSFFHYFLLLNSIKPIFLISYKIQSQKWYLISCTVCRIVFQVQLWLNEYLTVSIVSMFFSSFVECFLCLDHLGFLLGLHSEISKSTGERSCFNYHSNMCTSHCFDNICTSPSGYIPCFIHEVSQWYLQGQYL